MQHRIIELPEVIHAGEELAVSKLSFKPFLDYVRTRLEDRTAIKKEIYRMILDKFSQYPELEGEIDINDTGRYTELLNLLYIVLSTVVEDENQVIWGISVPLRNNIFYGTNALYDLLLAPGSNKIKAELQNPSPEMHEQKCTALYAYLLEKFYHFNLHMKQEMIYPMMDQECGLWKYYQVNLDTRFVEVTTDQPLPDLNLENLQVHLNEEQGIELLRRILPLKNFRFTGFSIFSITDVTTRHSLDRIRNVLINGHGRVTEENYDEISQILKSLAGTRDVEFSLLPIFRVNNQLVQDTDSYSHSILFSMGKQDGVLRDFFLPLLEKFTNNPRILYYKDLDQSGPTQVQVGKLFQLAGVKSYALVPIFYSNKLVGAFEMYSRKKGILNEQVFARMDPALVLIAQLIQNSVEDFNAKIADTIRDKFTSLQPSVQWKFSEAAWDYIYRSRQEGKSVPVKKIEFKNVYPLYGAVDMRNSTVERNKAVLADLQYQFNALQTLLGKLKNKQGMALTDDFIFKSTRWQRVLSDSLTTQDEIKLNQFLNDEVHPFLHHFKNASLDLAPAIDAYFQSINPAEGKAWENRRNLEDSMQLINNAVNNYLDLMNLEIQQAYPGYFEKFRTDGIEYDIYIGQSIAPSRPFDLVYLKNLRLWQLGSMAAIARLSHQLIPKMAIPLETTQLIFIYSNPIDICFRNDERRFDVEGGYNIRYHILKKRIDKVHIRNTGERLTQPGKIALIYFNQKDADEYASYIQHLQDKKILHDDLEFVELEELQGITGLKAMRVSVIL